MYTSNMMTNSPVDITINAEFSTSYFPKYTYKDGEPDEFLGTPPDCYDFKRRELQSPLKLREMKTKVLPIIPSKRTFDSFGHIGNILDVQRKLERSAVLGMIKAHVLDSSGDEHPSKLLFKAWNSVCRKTLRNYINTDARGVKREFISSLIQLRKNDVFDYSETFSRLLSPENKKINMSGIRYVPVGYITPDANVLRQAMWSYNSLKLDDPLMVQLIEHRRVAIFYDLITSNFIVKIYLEERDVYFDDFSDKSIIENISSESPEYKEMEIKVKEREINNYKPVCTRVFNNEKFTGEQSFTLSLKDFPERYDKRISVTVSDEDLHGQKHTPMFIYPVNYTLLIYSIIRTWLHAYSEYFGEEYEIMVKKPYFQCYYDELMGMYTNTYVVN